MKSIGQYFSLVVRQTIKLNRLQILSTMINIVHDFMFLVSKLVSKPVLTFESAGADHMIANGQNFTT